MPSQRSDPDGDTADPEVSLHRNLYDDLSFDELKPSGTFTGEAAK